MTLLTSAKLKELRKYYAVYDTLILKDARELFETLEKALAVVSAAKWYSDEYDRGVRKGYEATITADMDAHLKEALAPFLELRDE